MNFQYLVITNRNKEETGIIEADSLYIARRRLESKQYRVIEIKEQGGWSQFLEIFDTSKTAPAKNINNNVLLEFFKEMNSLQKTGFSTSECISFMRFDGNYKEKRDIAAFIYEKLNYGETLKTALEMAGFEKDIYEAISIGEAANDISSSLNSLVKDIETETMVRKEITSILIGPVVMMILLIASFVGSIYELMPMQKKVLDTLGAGLAPEDFPVMTRSALWLEVNGILMITLFTFVIVSIFIFFRYGGRINSNLALIIDKILNVTPFLSTFRKNRELARVANLMSLAVVAGRNQESVLNILVNSISSETIKRQIQESIVLIKNGNLMSEALDKVNFNRVIIAVIQRGEKVSKQESKLVLQDTRDVFIDNTKDYLAKIKSLSGLFNIVLITIASIPVLIMSAGVSIDQTVLMMNKM